MKRLLIFLVTLAATLSLSLAGSPTAQARSTHTTPVPSVVNYVALGDSYSAGVGNAPDYVPASGNCLRSTKAYSVLLAARSHRLNLDFEACDGATTDSLISDQLPAEPKTDVKTVTVTIGGNDVGTFSVLPDCMGLDGVPGCSDAAKALFSAALKNVLPGKMALALAGIHAAYPNARIYVGSYMELFGTRKSRLQGGRAQRPGVLHQLRRQGLAQHDGAQAQHHHQEGRPPRRSHHASDVRERGTHLQRPRTVRLRPALGWHTWTPPT